MKTIPHGLLVLTTLFVAPPTRADDVDPPSVRQVGPGRFDYTLRADCGWNVVERDGPIVAKLPAPLHPSTCDDLDRAVISADEAWLADANGLWSLRTRRHVAATPNGWGFAFSDDGRWLAYVDTAPWRTTDEIYAPRSRIVLLDLRRGSVRVSRRVLGVLSNGAPLSFLEGPPAVLVTDYALTRFAIPSLQASPVSWAEVGAAQQKAAR